MALTSADKLRQKISTSVTAPDSDLRLGLRNYLYTASSDNYDGSNGRSDYLDHQSVDADEDQGTSSANAAGNTVRRNTAGKNVPKKLSRPSQPDDDWGSWD